MITAHLIKYVFAHVHVHRGERVIQEIEFPLAVDGPSHAQTLLLAPGQVDSSLSCTK